MSERKIDAIDQLEIEIVEAGLEAWKANRLEGGGKLSSMTCAWRAMTRVATTAPQPPASPSRDGADGEAKTTDARELAVAILQDCAMRFMEGPQNNVDRAIELGTKIADAAFAAVRAEATQAERERAAKVAEYEAAVIENDDAINPACSEMITACMIVAAAIRARGETR